MSHRAQSWLAQLPAAGLLPSQFRVLFFLCYAHNAARKTETACFPPQARLMEATGLSNGALNNALNALEQAGLIRRVGATDPETATRRTYYILGMDLPEPVPEGRKQTPFQGEPNSISEQSKLQFEEKQTPVWRKANSSLEQGKLQPTGDLNGRILEESLGRAGTRAHARAPGAAAHSENESEDGAPPPDVVSQTASQIAENSNAQSAPVASEHDGTLQQMADWINSGRHVPPSMVSNTRRDALLASGLVTRERLRELQIY